MRYLNLIVSYKTDGKQINSITHTKKKKKKIMVQITQTQNVKKSKRTTSLFVYLDKI